MGKKCGKWLVVFVMMLLLSTSAFAAEQMQVIPLNTEETHALLLAYGEKYYLVGGSDLQKVEEELDLQGVASLEGIITPCAHEEHIVAVEELSRHYQTQVVSKENISQLQTAKVTWFEQGVSLSTEEKGFAFGVDEALDGCISYRCDGSLVPFAATTNETSVNVREKTSTKSERVTKIQRGERVAVAATLKNDENEIWYEVETSSGKKGYIRSDLLQYVSSETDISAALVQATETIAQENAKKETRYIGNKKSKVFHRPSCKTLPSGKNQVYFDSRDYAVSKGYKPCKNCDP